MTVPENRKAWSSFSEPAHYIHTSKKKSAEEKKSTCTPVLGWTVWNFQFYKSKIVRFWYFLLSWFNIMFYFVKSINTAKRQLPANWKTQTAQTNVPCITLLYKCLYSKSRKGSHSEPWHAHRPAPEIIMLCQFCSTFKEIHLQSIHFLHPSAWILLTSKLSPPFSVKLSKFSLPNFTKETHTQKDSLIPDLCSKLWNK